MKRKRNGGKPVFCERKNVPKIKQIKLDLLNKKDLNKFLKSKEFTESKIAEELIIEYISSVKENSLAKKMLLINKEIFNKYIKNNSINTKADVEAFFAICEETKEEEIKQISINLENKKELIKLLKENSKKHQKQIKVIISTYYYIDRKISRYKYRYIEKNRELNPFTNVTFCYGNDQNEITVPAIVLVKSRGDVVLYDDFYKSNIDWKSLTEEKRRELYTEFVLHYLPKELGDAAVGNPITFLIMIIVGAVIAKASAVIAACASLIGTGFSAVNIIEGCKLITKVAEG